jgi:hypothetical protein
VTALTVPATLLLASLTGIAVSLLHLVRVALRRAPAAPAADDVLLLLCAAAPFAAAAGGLAPAAPGVRPWLHAMPFLALLAARALLSAARLAWPARAAPLAASLALLVLWPAERATAHFHPAGSSAWNELAGGAPGRRPSDAPAGRRRGGRRRARRGEPARARRGAGVRPTAAPPRCARCARRPAAPDLAVAAGGRRGRRDRDARRLERDAEYRVWSAFRTARPAAGVYLDEVPLALVYARPGAWR